MGEDGNDLVQSPGEKPPQGGRANRQAVTRVNPEQASKVKSRTPTLLHSEEGRRAVPSTPSEVGIAVRRGIGDGMSGQPSTQRESPERSEGRDLGRPIEGRIVRESEGPIVPTKPGKLGGGKGPCFRNASEATEDRGLA